MAQKLADMVFECLQKHPEQKFTASEIADWIVNTYPEKAKKKIDDSVATVNPIKDISDVKAQYACEIGQTRSRLQKRHSEFKTTEGSRPRKFYFTESTDSAEIEQAEGHEPSPATKASGSLVKEHDLYPILSEFLWSELDLYSKRIDERRSRNSRGAGSNKWLYPDLVGMEDFSVDWNREIKDCVQQYADKKTKLWSFEVKILINRSNVREVFFQAVSNSSWANFGYLVASEIEGTDTMKELRMLSGLHGIGFIRLDAENPSESQIMIPAKERTEIDWNTANRLTAENNDFLDYVKLIRKFYQTGETRPSDWDMKTEQD